MKPFIFLLVLSCFGTVQAQGLFNQYNPHQHYPDNAQVFIYIKKEFGSARFSHDKSLKLGLSAGYSEPYTTLYKPKLPITSRPGTFLSIEYSTGQREISTFSLGGFIKSDIQAILKQNSEEGTDNKALGLSGMQWVIVGVGVVAVAVLVASSDSCNADTFQAEFRECP